MLQHRIEVIQIYYENGRTLKNTYNKLRDFFDLSVRPYKSTVRNVGRNI